jgi:hypothetical protein
MANRIQLRRGTAANWTSVNPVLAQGEAGFEVDTNRLKIGDGTTAWAALDYFGGDVGAIPTLLSELTNDVGYLTSYTETDPVFTASAAADIAAGDITNWDDAFSWGDHSTAGYALSSNIPDSILDLNITDGTNGQVLTANGDGTFSFTTVGGVSNTLDGLTDVSISTPVVSQILRFDGINWINDNETIGLELEDFSVTTAAAGSASLSYDNLTGVFTFTPPDLSSYLTSETDPVFTASEAASITSTDTSNWNSAHSWGDHSTAGYLIPTINTTTATSTALADDATANLELTGGRAYVLYKIETSHAAWVRVYTNAAARTADASRLQGVDPGANSGVIAEAITTGAETVVFAPAINGFNDEAPTTDVMPVAVTNLSGSTNDVVVTVTKLTMVA